MFEIAPFHLATFFRMFNASDKIVSIKKFRQIEARYTKFDDIFET